MFPEDLEAGQPGQLLTAFELAKEWRFRQLVARDQSWNRDESGKQHGNAPSAGGERGSQQQKNGTASHQAERNPGAGQGHPESAEATFRGKLSEQRRGSAKFATDSDSLDDSQRYQEHGRGNAELSVTR